MPVVRNAGALNNVLRKYSWAPTASLGRAARRSPGRRAGVLARDRRHRRPQALLEALEVLAALPHVEDGNPPLSMAPAACIDEASGGPPSMPRRSLTWSYCSRVPSSTSVDLIAMTDLPFVGRADATAAALSETGAGALRAPGRPRAGPRWASSPRASSRGPVSRARPGGGRSGSAPPAPSCGCSAGSWEDLAHGDAHDELSLGVLGQKGSSSSMETSPLRRRRRWLAQSMNSRPTFGLIRALPHERYIPLPS